MSKENSKEEAAKELLQALDLIGTGKKNIFNRNKVVEIALEKYSSAYRGDEKARWVKCLDREPTVGDYYYCKVDTKKDCIVKTIVEWGKHKNGEYEYNDWDWDNISHFGDFGEEAEVIEWLDEN